MIISYIPLYCDSNSRRSLPFMSFKKTAKALLVDTALILWNLNGSIFWHDYFFTFFKMFACKSQGRLKSAALLKHNQNNIQCFYLNGNCLVASLENPQAKTIGKGHFRIAGEQACWCARPPSPRESKSNVRWIALMNAPACSFWENQTNNYNNAVYLCIRKY